MSGNCQTAPEKSSGYAQRAGHSCPHFYYVKPMRLAVLLLLCATAFAQPRALTTADYARAEKFMTYNTTPLVYRAGVRPNWMAGDRFWYRITTPAGSEFALVDPA